MIRYREKDQKGGRKTGMNEMTNPVMDALLHRRSTRSFTNRHIEMPQLEQILIAAINAPNARGLQSWHLTAVRNQEKIRRLAAATGALLGNPHYNMYEPDTIILVGADRDNSNARQDTGCVMQSIFLAAHSLGIGSVWINQLKDLCDEPSVRQILTDFKMPENQLVWGVAALGYPDAQTPKKERRRDVINIVE